MPALAVARRSLALLTVAVWLLRWPPLASADPYGELNRSWDRFSAAYEHIAQDYYAPMPPDSIMLGAIEGMLGRLDAYSQYFDGTGLRQLREDTSGRFAGLGITVVHMDGYPVIVAPMPGTPAEQAGLVPGDQIRAIAGRNTRDLPLDDVVAALRGEPQTQVTVTVYHPGQPARTRDVTITREVVSIPSVALVELVGSGVGYIGMRQTRFSESTGAEVDAAVRQLRQQGAHSLVLDLRGNPGGLLAQATQVAELFLPPGAPIVSIRERDGRPPEVRRGRQQPSARELPLAVLIDGASASAAEIVAGAIQDNDRGVIVGTTSFGKGSVQTIFDLQDDHDSALKLTTARYYTPSGRSIHREGDGESGADELPIEVGERRLPLRAVLQTVAGARDAGDARDRLMARFDLPQDAAAEVLSSTLSGLLGAKTTDGDGPAPATSAVARPAYTTRGGRPVYGGGGIAPDTVVEPQPVSDWVQQLQRDGLLFAFVVHWVACDSVQAAALAGAELDSALLAGLERYLAERADVPQVDARQRRELSALRHGLSQLGLLPQLAAALDGLEAELTTAVSSGRLPPPLQQQLLRHLRPLLALRLGGRTAELRAWLEDDPQLARAIGVLADGEAYSQTLSGTGQ